MYGWLTYEGKALMWLTIPGWVLQDLPCSKEEVALRQRAAGEFVKHECSKDAQEQRDRIKEDLDCIVPHVRADVLDFALYMCRAHHMLLDAQRQKREEVIEGIIEGIFGDDLKSLSADQVSMLNVLRRVGILMSDAFQKTQLGALTAKFRMRMLSDKFTANLPENVGFLRFGAKLGLTVKDQKETDETIRNSQEEFYCWLMHALLSRPASKCESLKMQMMEVLNDKNMAYVHRAYKQMIDLHRLLSGEISDALASIIEELYTSQDNPQDVIDRRVASAVAEHESRVDHTLWATVAALEGGVVKMGKTEPESRKTLASFQEAVFSFREKMTLAARATKELPKQKRKAPKGAPQKSEIPGEKEDIDPVWSWSVERLARWIEGPVIETVPKRAVVCEKILRKEKVEREQALKTYKKKIVVVNEGEIGDVIENALSATARFFLDEIGDMLQLARALKADEELTRACEKRTRVLAQLAARSVGFNEEKVRVELMAAEADIQALRQGLKTAKFTALVEKSFPGQLSMALSKEKMVLGKRHGGQISCPVTFDDWSYVADNFHHRWVPGITSIEVDGETMHLEKDQAVALYVTGSSLSGYAFDVSVHLWRRRAGKTSRPSDGSGQFPPMNMTDWFDTWAPCCVLHVPHFQK